jgi:Flp pilus assembly protein TadD
MTFRRLLPGFLCFAATAALAADPAGEVVSLDGKGEVREAQQANWKPVAVKTPLFPTNFVRTLDMSRMAILLAGGTQTRLAPNSVLQIKEASSGPDGRTVVEQSRGRSWTQSKNVPNGLIMQTPSALAAIRGTDWEMVVDDDGRATLSVFSGEVEFSNEQGNVLVAANEQARAEKGKAPVKLQLRVSRERVQWVSSATVDASRYGEFRRGVSGDLAQVQALLREQRLAEAYSRVQALAAGEGAQAVVYLLLGDFEVYRGDLAAASQVLARGAARHPDDERLQVALARVALLSDDLPRSRERVRAALERRGDSVEALVMLGDLERHEGHAREALAAYSRAIEISANDARPWHGRGVVESERENVRRARADLVRAVTLDESDATYRAELGTLETFANDFQAARAAIAKALELQPDNYVALTGLGVLELKTGNEGAAIEALLKASLIEPRYSRAHLYLAAAYYQSRREAAALAELKRAMESDPNDPLPHLLMSMVYLDRFEGGRAVEEAQQALGRIGFLKSLNQVADNQKGVANVGAPLAFMGLEAWARSAAHESYLPFWGGSHLFLADRYPGDFDKRSELMQGFITDPLAFGASNRFQSLITEPGYHGTLSMRYNQSSALRLMEPVITLNGLDASRIPFAYLVEGVYTRVDPRGTDLALKGPTYTVALGAKPSPELALFLYVNRFNFDADLGASAQNFSDTNHIEGKAGRVDVGARYAFDASSSLWLKAGGATTDATSDENSRILATLEGGTSAAFVQLQRFEMQPRTHDGALRYTKIFDDRLELTAGVESSRSKLPKVLVRDTSFHLEGTQDSLDSVDQTDRDRSDSAYAVGRWSSGGLRLEAGAMWARYEKDRDIHVVTGGLQPLDVFVTETYRRNKTDPIVGATWRFTPSSLARGACRRWNRPIGVDTLAPVAVAGMALDDQLVLSGGVLEQCRAQWEWNAWHRGFVTAFVERSKVENLVSPLDGVQNTQSDLSNPDRLRNRALAPPPKPDLLEAVPQFGRGIARRASLAGEAILTPTLGVRVHYIHTDSENTAPEFSGKVLPWLPRHLVNFGLTWAAGGRSYLTAQMVYRTERFSDEANLQPVRAGWDGQVALFVETDDKRWAAEAYAGNLFKKDVPDLFGIVVSYRF